MLLALASIDGGHRRHSRAGIIGRMRIPLKRLDPDLPVPAHAQPGDGGVDLHARQSVTLAPGERVIVPTGIAVAIPVGHAGLVTPRSGLAARSGIGVVNGPGLVDSGYRGEIKVILVNHGDEPVDIERGDRIAQLVVVPVAIQEFEVVDELPESARGEGGLGSTGS
jgi:dUTP pyrophosphatase